MSSHQLLILLTLQNPRIQNHLGETRGGGAGVPSVSPLHLQSKMDGKVLFVKSSFFKLGLHIFSFKTCLKCVIFTIIPCVLCTCMEGLFSELIFFAAFVQQTYIFVYISWNSQCPIKLEEIGKNSLRGGNIFWAGENIGKYDRFTLGKKFLPVTFLFLLQPVANSRARIYRSKSRKKETKM